MHKDVESFIKSCDTCQRFKAMTGLPMGYLHNIPVSRIFEHFHLDIVGPLNRTDRGNLYVITTTDAFSKFAFARPCQNVRTTEVIKFCDDIFMIHGTPEIIITDRGAQFISEEWKTFCNQNSIKRNLTTPYHPQSNGIDERVNGTLVKILRTYVDEFQTDWDLRLKKTVFLYNTTVHETTGYSPYQVVFGYDPRSPLRVNQRKTKDIEEADEMRVSIRDNARRSIEEAQRIQKRYYDKRHRQSLLRVGEQVLIREHTCPQELTKKLYPNWYGPVLVTDLLGGEDHPRAVEIFDFENIQKKIVSVSNVKPYVTRVEEMSNEEEGKGDAPSAAAHEDSTTKLFVDTDLDEEPQIPYKTNCQSDSDSGSLFEHTTGEDNGHSVSRRRVTITDNAETRIFDPQETISETNVTTRRETEPSVSGAGENQHTEPAAAPYLMDFIIDDSTIDPTYKPTPTSSQPPKVQSSKRDSRSSERSSTGSDKRRSSIPLSHRYNTRSRAKDSDKRPWR